MERVWRRDRTGAFAFVLLLSSRAVAQGSGAMPPRDVPPEAPAAAPEPARDITFDERANRYVRISAMLSRLAEREQARVEQIAERYARLVAFTRQLEARADAEFAERAERYMRLRELTRRLEAERAEQEAQAFDQSLSLFLRKRAFMQRLDVARAATRGDAHDRGSRSQHDELYTR
jgi:hypothetical protein